MELLSSIYQRLYPTPRDCYLVNKFISCPLGLEDKYEHVRLADLLVSSVEE